MFSYKLTYCIKCEKSSASINAYLPQDRQGTGKNQCYTRGNCDKTELQYTRAEPRAKACPINFINITNFINIKNEILLKK